MLSDRGSMYKGSGLKFFFFLKGVSYSRSPYPITQIPKIEQAFNYCYR